jgi:hypothetical protein
MTDYTREQQIADIARTFGPTIKSIRFNDELERIYVETSPPLSTYVFIIGSDDDGEMNFFNSLTGEVVTVRPSYV